MASLSIQSQTPIQPMTAQKSTPAPVQDKPAAEATPKMASDSLTLASTPSLGNSLKEGVKFQAGLGAKTGAVIGAVSGGVTLPILAVALTGGGALGDNKMLLGSLAVGALGGAAAGAGIGALSGSVSGAVNGAIVSVADSKQEAQLYTGLAAGGVSILKSVSNGDSMTKGAVKAVVSGGIAAFIGGKIYDNATQQ